MFITNTPEKNLEKRIKELIAKSSQLKFLVGFFYFSGLNIFYETLKEFYQNGKLSQEFLKILVGLNVDVGIYGIYENAKKLKNFNINNLKQDFFNSIKKAFTSTELDNQLIYEQIDFFKELLLKKIIVIRKTKEPNHAKLYLFKMDENSRVILPGLIITGSSNLTKAGIREQDEFNVEIKDYGFKEAEEYFDNLWQKAIELNEDDIQKVIQIFDKETFFRKITPFEAYVYLLKTYLELHQGSYQIEDLKLILKERGYKAFDYQLTAVSQALANCEVHGGCILADVVGLGKSIIACLTAKALGKRGIVICPPHLIGNQDKTSGWKKYLEDFKLWDWEVWSLGKLKEALNFVKNHPEIEIIIVDEAHRFRNQRTESYHYLREICRGKTVLLLSATPFNNRPSDIFALLKLFTIPKRSTIVYDQNLEDRFRAYESEFQKLAYIKKHWNSQDSTKKRRAVSYYNSIFSEKLSHISFNDLAKVNDRAKKLALKIKGVLEVIVIRRNRLDLKYFKDYENIEFSEIKDPIEVFFELTKEQLEFYDEVIKSFYLVQEGGKFKGAVYLPILYEKGINFDYFNSQEQEESLNKDSFIFLYQRNLYDLMRRLLVKRFESSFGAFYQSLKNFIEFYKLSLDFAKKTQKFILDKKLMEDIYNKDEDSILEELLNYKKTLQEEKINSQFYKIYEINKFKLKEEFFNDIESDIALFEDLMSKMDSLSLLENDSKANKLIEVVKNFLKDKRKVVIFTEYRDTVFHLKRFLQKHFSNRVLVAVENLSNKTIREIYTNFDAQYSEQEDNYDILLTTDKLSEGFNLNRAGVVINYDIPWNPVRVIQRVGRINRIAKKVYDEIYIINFFPTEKGADHVRSREIAESKMFMIHNVLGEDSKIFSPDEEPQPSELYKRLITIPQEEEEESFYTKVKKEFDSIISKNPKVLENLKNLPVRIKISKKGNDNELMVFIKKNKDLFIGYQNYNNKYPENLNFQQVFEKIKADITDINLPLSNLFWKNYHQILEGTFFEQYQTIRASNTLYEISYRTLKGIIQLQHQKLKPYYPFISNLMEDIREYHTVSEYLLEEIAQLEEIINKINNLKDNNFDKMLLKIIEKLEAIKNELGEDFILKIQRYLKEHHEEIIIAIENLKI